MTFFERKIIKNYIKSAEKICHYCKTKLENHNITIDHKTPLKRGGFTERKNICISCKSCNTLKADMTEAEILIFLEMIRGKADIEIKTIRSEYLATIDRNVYPEIIKYNNIEMLVPYATEDFMNIEEIYISNFLCETTIKNSTFKKAEKYYNKFGCLKKPLLIYKNTLIEGYSLYLFCKHINVDIVPIKKIDVL